MVPEEVRDADGSKKPNGGNKHERYFYEAAVRGWCSFRTSDQKMEPENGSVHLHRA